MQSILDQLKGRKTYLAALGMALYGVYLAMNGDMASATGYFLSALGFFGVRQAIAGVTPPVSPPTKG